MDTIRRGNAAEAAVLKAFTSVGIGVFIPFGDGLPFDLVAAPADGRVIRVQVKSGRLRGGCVEFNSSSTDHGRGRQHYLGRADLFAVHVAVIDRVFIIAVDECPRIRGYLRLEPTRNNQKRRVRLAEDYTFESWAEGVVGAPVAA
jgi:hypothetical protein